MGATITTIDKILKYVYSDKALQNAVYVDNPLLALMPKKGGFDGRSHIHAITYGNSLARSASFATAQGRAAINGQSSALAGNSGKNLDVNFIVTRMLNYGVYSITQEALLAARGNNKGAFASAVTQQIDGALQTLNNDMGRDVYGDGSGSLGQVLDVSSTTITVGEAITQIEVNMELVASTGSTKTAILRNSATGCYVTSVNRSAGTFTINANTDTITTGDWLFIKGDRQTAAITANSNYLKIQGVDAWVPYAAPSSSESFYGVDRSVDATRLAGQRLDISSLQPEEGYITALAALAREGGAPSHIFSSFTDEKNFKLAVGSRVEMEYSQVGDVGFESMRIRGPKGPVRIYADRNAPVGYAKILTLNTWELKHLGDFVNKGDAAGDSGLAREYQADSFEGRMSFYGNVLCYKPSANMNAKLPT